MVNYMEVYKGHMCRYLWRFSHSLFQSWTIENCRSFWQLKSNHEMYRYKVRQIPTSFSRVSSILSHRCKSPHFNNIRTRPSFAKYHEIKIVDNIQKLSCDLSPRDLEESPFMFHARKDRLFDVLMLVDITMKETVALHTASWYKI